jgi:hypothetical protein
MARSKYDLSGDTSETEVDPNTAAPSFVSPQSNAERLFQAATRTPSTYDPDREAAPGTASAPPSTPSSASDAARRRSILATIMAIESGGRNIPQSIRDINTEKGTPAQGYFQIIDPTWMRYGGGSTDYKSAIHAPYETQRQIALNIPVNQWGPATQNALRANGYEPKSGETLGQMLQRYGEDPNATSPSDSGTGVVPTTSTVQAPPVPSGLLAGGIGSGATDQARKDKEEEAAATELTKTGMGLLSKGTIQAPRMPMPSLEPDMPRQQQPFQWLTQMPDFTQSLGQPDFTQILAQQRLQRRR